MKSIALLTAALVCACLAACASPSGTATATSSAAPTVDLSKVTPEQRTAAEAAFDASVVGLEVSLQSGALEGQAKTDAHTGLLAGYAAMTIARSTFAASGQTATPGLEAQMAQTDRDYQRVLAEL